MKSYLWLSVSVLAIFVLIDRSAAALGSLRGEAGLLVCVFAVCACLLAERLLWTRSWPAAYAALGLGRPTARSIRVALGVGALLLLVLPVFAALTGSDASLYAGWPALVPGLFAQGGVAEEVLFRGYLFGTLRADHSFVRATVLSIGPFLVAHLLLFATMSGPAKRDVTSPEEFPMHRPPFGLLLTVAIAASIVGGGAQTSDPLVKENATVKLADHTYVIPDGNVGLVPNVGIVVGTRGTLVIDPGLGRRNGETVLREVAKVSKNTELFIASTHFHAEHTTGYLAFPPAAKYVNSTVQEADFAQGGPQQIQNFAARSPVTAELLKGATGRRADITFDREYSLDLGGVQVRFLLVGPTHTRGDTALFVEGDRVLFAGDVVMNNSFVAANQGSSVRAWLAAFDAFEAMGPTMVVPAHGPVGEGSIVAVNRDVMREVQARVRALKAEGRSIDDTAGMVQKELQAKHPGWPRANGLAGAARAAFVEAP